MLRFADELDVRFNVKKSCLLNIGNTFNKKLALLEAFGYYRKYIPHFLAIAMPLTDLTKKGLPNVITSRWSGDCQQAYDSLKAELSSTQVLRIPTIGTPFHLHSVGRPWEPPWDSSMSRVLNNP